ASQAKRLAMRRTLHESYVGYRPYPSNLRFFRHGLDFSGRRTIFFHPPLAPANQWATGWARTGGAPASRARIKFWWGELDFPMGSRAPGQPPVYGASLAAPARSPQAADAAGGLSEVRPLRAEPAAEVALPGGGHRRSGPDVLPRDRSGPPE